MRVCCQNISRADSGLSMNGYAYQHHDHYAHPCFRLLHTHGKSTMLTDVPGQVAWNLPFLQTPAASWSSSTTLEYQPTAAAQQPFDAKSWACKTLTSRRGH